MNKSTDEVLGLTAQIVSAHVGHNAVAADALPGLIQEVYRALLNIGQQPAQAERPAPAVPVKQSVRQDRIVCLEDGKSFSMLKRHLMTDHKLTPQQYLAKSGACRATIQWWRQTMRRPGRHSPRRSGLGGSLAGHKSAQAAASAAEIRGSSATG